MVFPRFPLALLGAATLAACSGLPPSQSQSERAALQSAFVILGDDGAPIARAITTAPDCPRIELDGRSATMRVRAPLSPIPLRPPAASGQGRPAPVSTAVQSCELALPAGVRSASVAGVALPLPAPAP